MRDSSKAGCEQMLHWFAPAPKVSNVKKTQAVKERKRIQEVSGHCALSGACCYLPSLIRSEEKKDSIKPCENARCGLVLAQSKNKQENICQNSYFYYLLSPYSSTAFSIMNFCFALLTSGTVLRRSANCKLAGFTGRLMCRDLHESAAKSWVRLG